MLTPTELARMREDVAPSLPDTLVIHRATRTADGVGGQTSVWAAFGTVACRVEPVDRGQGEEIAGSREAEPTEYVIHLPYDETVTPDDRVVYAGETFEILEVVDHRSWDVHTRLRAVRS